MRDSGDRPALFEFGPFRVDARRRLVWRAGVLLDVPPKAVELLVALVGEAGEVVSKDELLRQVWPDTFVEEANLSVNVSILRKALGEQADGQPYIQTLARRGYRFLGQVTSAAASVPRTLAVLPFRPLMPNDADEPLGLGMADALIARLAGTGRIAVRPTAAIRRFAGPDTDPLEVGRQLRVDAVVDGRFRKADSRLLVSAQLLPVAGASPLWAERFEEALTSVFEVEAAIAAKIAASLVVELTAEERRRLGRRHTGSVEAWHAYARGRCFWGRFSRPSVEKAMASFQEAARLDPGYALPYAGLADVFMVAGLSGAVAPKRAWSYAAEAAERARKRDELLAECHVSSAFLRLFADWDWAGAERQMLRAVELEPLSAAPHQWHALVLGLGGRFAEAHRSLGRAREIDPLSVIAAALEGLLLAFEGRHEEEVAQQRRAVELDPQHFVAQWGLGGALLNVGAFAEAIEVLCRALDLAEDTPFLRPFLARALALAGRDAEARALLGELPHGLCYQRAGVFVALGELSSAIRELRAAVKAREAWVVAAAVDPAFVVLRQDAAFQSLVRQVRAGQD
jgi:DNA-binding winged helix-turn-helix (wHTH) protein/Flp pilus assembly protein TadD